MYFASVMVISTLSILANVFVLSLHHKNVKTQPPMPEWVEKWVCVRLGRLLGMQKPYKKLNEKIASTYFSFDNFTNGKRVLPNILINDRIIEEKKHLVTHSLYRANSITSMSYTSRCTGSSSLKSNLSICENCSNMLMNPRSEVHVLKEWLVRITRELEVITKRTKQDIQDENKGLNWKFAAMVVDRLCMIIFATATFTTTFTFSLNFFFEPE